MNPLASRITEPCVIITALGSGFAARHPNIMTNEQINEAIAETCGWVSHKNADGDLSEPHLTRSWTEWIRPDGEAFTTPPDYCNDLNAMACAEDTLSDEQWDIYSTWLCITTDYKTSRLRAHELIRAKAHERAEAFLRALDKWK